jgi:hypothetical protein
VSLFNRKLTQKEIEGWVAVLFLVLLLSSLTLLVVVLSGRS